ncbi:MAG: glutamate racemase [Firmicutes bacterium]|nr:glutamate racemase [Bacillota bacterium]
MDERYKAIGLIDSGVGGLTVLKEIRRLMPGENIVYFGDTEHMPYGPRSREEIRSYVTDIIRFLYTTQDIKMIVIACNTATVAGLEYFQRLSPVPVVGVVEPGALGALSRSQSKRIGVVATQGTIESGAYENIITRAESNAKVFSVASPLFAIIVESGLYDNPEIRCLAAEYLRPIKDKGIDTLILGCTHYPLLSGIIKVVMGPGVDLVDPATFTAQHVQGLLESENLTNDSPKGWLRFFVSRDPKQFSQTGAHLLGQPIEAYLVSLEGAE